MIKIEILSNPEFRKEINWDILKLTKEQYISDFMPILLKEAEKQFKSFLSEEHDTWNKDH